MNISRRDSQSDVPVSGLNGSLEPENGSGKSSQCVYKGA